MDQVSPPRRASRPGLQKPGPSPRWQPGWSSCAELNANRGEPEPDVGASRVTDGSWGPRSQSDWPTFLLFTGKLGGWSPGEPDEALVPEVVSVSRKRCEARSSLRLNAVIFDTSASVCCPVAHSCPIFCASVDCSPPVSSVPGISQARILEWVAMASSRGSSQPRDRTCVSCVSASVI